MLTDEEKEFYALAKEIAEGKRSIYVVYEVFAQYPDTAAKIINFWMRCDEFTQSVAHYLAIEKAKYNLKFAQKKKCTLSTLLRIIPQYCLITSKEV